MTAEPEPAPREREYAPVEPAPAPTPGPVPPAPAVVVVTFASFDYVGAAEVLRHSALLHGGADRVLVYREADLDPWFDAHPFESCPAPAKGYVRGYGWWSWKPWVIRDAMRRCPGHAVVYCDAAMAFQRSVRPHVDATESVGLFRLGPVAKGYTNERWTKPDALDLMRATPAQRAAPQCNAALQIYRDTPDALAFLDEYARWCSNYEVLDDTHRVARPAEEFQAHRHDQSVLSVLAAGRPAVTMFRDPTQYGVDDPCLVPSVDGEPLVHHHRACVKPVRVAVITPTVGTPHLAACLKSVQAQDLPNVRHYVVIDGPEHAESAQAAIEAITRGAKDPVVPVHALTLPHNVGAGGWCGHR